MSATFSNAVFRQRCTANGKDSNSKVVPSLKTSLLKGLNTKFQALSNCQTRNELHSLLDHVKPDIVVGTEIWQNSDVHDAKIVPNELGYDVVRRDRSTRGGGILNLVSKRCIARRVELFESNCEILWVKTKIAGSKPLQVAAYYMQNETSIARGKFA